VKPWLHVNQGQIYQ